MTAAAQGDGDLFMQVVEDMAKANAPAAAATERDANDATQTTLALLERLDALRMSQRV